MWLLNTLETEFQNYVISIVKTAAMLAYKETKPMPLGDWHMQISVCVCVCVCTSGTTV